VIKPLIPQALEPLRQLSGGGRAVFGGFLVTAPGSQLHDSLDTNVQGIQLLPDDALRHSLTQVLYQKPHTAVLWEREGVETHTFPPLRDGSALTTARNPLAVDGTTISFSPFSWALRPVGQDARNHARKERVSRGPVIKMGVLLGRSPAVKQVLATWACGVVPSGLPLRGPDMSLDMHLFAFSDETTGSDGSEPMDVGLSGPLRRDGAAGPTKTAAYVAPPSVDPSCQLQVAACSPVTAGAPAGRGADPSSGAGRRLAGSKDSPELTSSLALRLPAS
jgi:hypothetical protein